MTAKPVLVAVTLLLSCAAAVASAQAPTASAQPPAGLPVPGELELAKLVWSTMAMIDHANKSGNYSVLRDSSAAGFQLANDPARLAQIFSALRAPRINLSNTLLLAPRYSAGPQLVRPDMLRVQGYFPLRPRAIAFDFYFQWQQGDWRLFAVGVDPRDMNSPAPQAAEREP